jgi:Putative phosphatase (DUF442)
MRCLPTQLTRIPRLVLPADVNYPPKAERTTTTENDRKNFNQIGGGVFLGPQPSEGDLAEAKRQGIATVIDLRLPSETAMPNASLVRMHEFNYVNVPVDKAALPTDQIAALEQAIAQTGGAHLVFTALLLQEVLFRSPSSSWLQVLASPAPNSRARRAMGQECLPLPLLPPLRVG